jgi:hypothetical protein
MNKTQSFTLLVFFGWFMLFEGFSPAGLCRIARDCVHHGDVNGDGVITAADAQLAFMIVLGMYSPTYEEECAADCNGDGIVTAGDAQMIFMTALGQAECADPIPDPTATPAPTNTPTSGPSPTPTPTSPFVTLIEKSNGLGTPQKENGRTEYELSDVNGDGHLDIISVGDHGSPGSQQHGISIWFGDGLGNWSVVQEGNFGYGGCALGDLNNDGVMDIAWGIHHDYGSGGFGDKLIGAALGNGTGTGWVTWDDGLASAGEDWGMFATDLADFDNNGLLDIVSQSFGAGNGVQVYQNNGDGTWTHQWAITGWNANYTLETGDFNADGNMDFICTRWGDTERTNVYFGDGAFGFTLNHNGLPDTHFSAVDAGDFNNNGADDILIALSDGVRAYTFDTGTNQWENASNGLPVAGSYSMVQFGYFNGDAFLDAVVYSAPTGQIFTGDGDGNWTPDATFSFSGVAYFSAMRVDGDFDHDGREDIVVQAAEGTFYINTNILQAYSPWCEPALLSTALLTPKGGETLVAGSVRFVRWLAAVPADLGESRIDLYLSVDGPDGPWTPVATDLPDNNRFQWIVPDVSSSTCRMKVLVTAGYAFDQDISPADFTIVQR